MWFLDDGRCEGPQVSGLCVRLVEVVGPSEPRARHCGLPCVACGVGVQTWTGGGRGPSGAGVGLGPGGVTPCTILKTVIGNRDQRNAINASAYSSKTSEASAFA